MAREQIQMSNLEEQADPLKPHDRVESNTAARPYDSGISIWKLFKYADSFDLWLMAFGTVGAITDGMTMPLIRLLVLSNLIDTIGNFGSASTGDFSRIINTYTLRLLYISIAAFFAAFLEAFCWARTSERQASRMRINYLKAVLRQGEGFFDTQRTTTAEVVTSVTNDTLVIQDVLAEKLPNFVMNTSLLFSSYFVAFYLTWRLALASFPFVIMLIIPGIMYGRILVGTSRKFSEAYNIAGNIAEQALSSIRTVFAFVGEERTMAKFSDALNGTVKLGLKQGLVKGLAIGSGGVTFGIWAFNSWYGSRLVMYHGASGGRIFVASICILNGGLALGTALPNIRYFSEARVACKRVFDMVDREPIIDWEDAKGEILKEVSGKVEFRNVEFAYPSRPESKIFRNFCLTIPANKTVALVGRSGSGKSTAVALLERFYDPLAGEILLDGVNTKTLQLKWLRSQIGLVSQEPALFATSIKENILFGKEGASMDQVIAAAKSSNAHDFISQLPDGYDTQVGERGVQMSGGQKQRIAIARVMLKDPRLLLLDEATSALDAESERIVQNALDKASVGRTTIVVAHCLFTIRNADMIAVVQSGHVIETGMHEDLICKPNGAYAALVKLQLAAADKPDERFEGTTMLDQSLVTRSSSIYTRSSSNASVSTHRELVHEEKLVSAASFRQLFLLNAPEWRHALLGCSGALCSGAVQPVFPIFLGATVSVFFLQDHDQIKSSIEYYSFMFVAVGVISFSANMLQHYNFAAMGEYLTKRVRERMLSKILTFEIGWFDNEENSSGAVCSRLATDVNVASI
eukprot:PITA_15976